MEELTKKLTMHDLTDDEKPREKALKQGLNALTDVELLAILLGSGIPGKSVLDLSREILKDNENRLAYLARKSIPELVKKYKGMGTAKATLLVAAMAFGARAQADMQIQDPQITTSETVYSYMRSRLERLNNEEFWVLHLNRANRLQSVEQISRGGQSQTAVDVKLIAKSVIDRLSAGIIICHNHPSGNMNPSGPDDNITRRIVEVCKLIDVTVLDHVIVGPTGYYSYRDNGRL
jgi:DNA repair protein RadC